MRNYLLGFLASLLFFNVVSGSYVRVINAVEQSGRMDVWLLRDQMENLQSSQNQNMAQPAVRLFQNLTYGQLPPHFFVWDKTSPWTFVFNMQMSQQGNQSQSGSSGSQSGSQMNADTLTLQQIQSLPTFTSTLNPNTNYTLIVASQAQQGGQSGQSGSQGSLQFLLLLDNAPSQSGQQGQSGSGSQQTYIRLVNLVQTQNASLVANESQCQSQGQSGSESGSASQGEIIPLTPYLQPSQYTLLPSSSSLQNLRICINGQSTQVYFAPIFQGSSTIYSIFVFNLNNSTRNEIALGLAAQSLGGGAIVIDLSQQKNEGQSGQQSSGSQTQLGQQGESESQQGQTGSQGSSSGQNQTQAQQYAPFIADDQPTIVNNSRIRAIHAAQGFPAVNVYLDGQLLFSSITYANVTMYQPTLRGVHNITIVPASTQDLQGLNLNVQFPYSVLVYLAWDSYYTLAILPTGLELMLSNQSQGQSGQSGSQGSLDLSTAFRSDIGNGFLGPLHRIFLDTIPVSSLRPDAAFVQVYNLAVNIGPVNVTVGQSSFIVLPLEDTPYRPIQPSSNVIRLTAITGGSSSQQALPSVQQSFEPNTLYTVFILNQPGGGASVFVQRDRSVRVVCSVLNIDETQGQQGQSGSQSGQSGSQGQQSGNENM